jgi:hypothetical protein
MPKKTAVPVKAPVKADDGSDDESSSDEEENYLDNPVPTYQVILFIDANIITCIVN